jgi:hypothetical protein
MRGSRRSRTLLLAAALVMAGGVVAEAAGPYQYYPVNPCRAVDTREGYGGLLYQGVERQFTIKGTCGVPTDAQAVSLNVTVVGANDFGWFALYPTGGVRPAVSTLNFAPADYALANGAIVPLSADTSNELTVYLATFTALGTAHVLLDVNGYFK